MARFARVEVAKSGRSTCVHCGKLIARGGFRLLIDPRGGGGQRPEFFHLACGLQAAPKLAREALAVARVPVDDAPEDAREAPLPAAVREALDARPRDETTRRVYADWLESRGDALGRYITATLEGRVGEADKLRKAHQAKWLAGVSPRTFVWERGLVESTSLSARTASELARRVGEVLALPACACLETLELIGPAGPEVYRAFARAPRSLTDLTLELGPGLEQLDAPWVERLTVVVTRTRAPIALEASRLPRLKALHLAARWSARALDEASLTALRDAPLLRRLEELTLLAPLLDRALVPAFSAGEGPLARAIRAALVRAPG